MRCPFWLTCSPASLPSHAASRLAAPPRSAPRPGGYAMLPLVRQEFWFWYGYRPGNRLVARQTLR